MCFINAFLILLKHESKEITMGKHVAWMGKYRRLFRSLGETQWNELT